MLWVYVMWNYWSGNCTGGRNVVVCGVGNNMGGCDVDMCWMGHCTDGCIWIRVD
jgi:hypothetical protein